MVERPISRTFSDTTERKLTDSLSRNFYYCYFHFQPQKCKEVVINSSTMKYKTKARAHIYGFSENGPRPWSENSQILESELNSHKNLILLCKEHHDEIDENESKYPPEILFKIKADYESHTLRETALSEEALLDFARKFYNQSIEDDLINFISSFTAKIQDLNELSKEVERIVDYMPFIIKNIDRFPKIRLSDVSNETIEILEKEIRIIQKFQTHNDYLGKNYNFQKAWLFVANICYFTMKYMLAIELYSKLLEIDKPLIHNGIESFNPFILKFNYAVCKTKLNPIDEEAIVIFKELLANLPENEFVNKSVIYSNLAAFYQKKDIKVSIYYASLSLEIEYDDITKSNYYIFLMQKLEKDNPDDLQEELLNLVNQINEEIENDKSNPTFYFVKMRAKSFLGEFRDVISIGDYVKSEEEILNHPRYEDFNYQIILSKGYAYLKLEEFKKAIHELSVIISDEEKITSILIHNDIINLANAIEFYVNACLNVFKVKSDTIRDFYQGLMDTVKKSINIELKLLKRIGNDFVIDSENYDVVRFPSYLDNISLNYFNLGTIYTQMMEDMGKLQIENGKVLKYDLSMEDEKNIENFYIKSLRASEFKSLSALTNLTLFYLYGNRYIEGLYYGNKMLNLIKNGDYKSYIPNREIKDLAGYLVIIINAIKIFQRLSDEKIKEIKSIIQNLRSNRN